MYQQSCPVLLIYPCVECGVNLGNLNVLPKDFKRTYVVRPRGQYLMRKICVNPPTGIPLHFRVNMPSSDTIYLADRTVSCDLGVQIYESG